MPLLRKVIIGALLALLSSPALSQSTQLGAGQVLGNSTAAQRPARAESVTAILDRALGSTRGAIIERGAVGWGIVGPSATAGLAWVSAGTGADPLYGVVGLAGGGCNAALVASNGGVLYSTASACSILAGTATARQMLQSGASAAPAWSTTTWPATTTINRLLYSSAANVIGEITTANTSIFTTTAGGVPGWVSTIPCANFPALTGDITTVANACATTLATVNANVGVWGSATQAPQFTVNAKGLITAAANVTITPAFSSITGQATLAQLPSIASNTVLANITGGAAVPTAATPTSIIDTMSGCSTQGGVLYRNATQWVCLAPGTVGQVLQTGGAAANPSWSTVGGTGTVTSVTAGTGLSASTNPITTSGTLTNTGVVTVKHQKFTASGTYTPSAGMIYATIECVGGGAGGGGSAGSVGQLFAGGGGGSGSYSRLIASAATIGASKAVTIGAAGAGGAAGSNNGAAGGDTSVGTLCIAKGGSGGLYGAGAQVGGGGAGGVAGTGDLAGAGMAGGPGNYNSAAFQPALPAGFGGSSMFGGGAAAPAFAAGAATAGAAATGFGSGGSGAISSNIAANAAGGNGSAGYVFITEFCSQ